MLLNPTNILPREHTHLLLIYSFQLVILAILATRMHLHLWHTDRYLRSPDALVFDDVWIVGRNLSGSRENVA